MSYEPNSNRPRIEDFYSEEEIEEMERLSERVTPKFVSGMERFSGLIDAARTGDEGCL